MIKIIKDEIGYKMKVEEYEWKFNPYPHMDGWLEIKFYTCPSNYEDQEMGDEDIIRESKRNIFMNMAIINLIEQMGVDEGNLDIERLYDQSTGEPYINIIISENQMPNYLDLPSIIEALKKYQ